MPRIQVPELTAGIIKRYGIKGQSAGETLSPEIVPVAIVDVLERPEYGQAAFGFKSLTSAVNGNCVGVRVVPGQGVFVVIEKFEVSISSGKAVTAHIGDHSLTGAVTYGRFRDDRISGQPALQLRVQDAAAVPATANQWGGWYMGANVKYDIVGPFNLTGQAISFFCGTGSNLYLTIYWKEYPETVL